MKLIFSILLFLICSFSELQALEKRELNYSIIPMPSSLKMKDGKFKFPTKLRIYAENKKDVSSAINSLEGILQNCGISILWVRKPQNADMLFLSDKKIRNEEEYSLEIEKCKIIIRSTESSGAFYAIQTLRQLMPGSVEMKDKTTELTVRCCLIQDQPSFSYRGLMFDVARYFFSIDQLKRYIDLLSMYKFNRFHLHLTDDQGWRMEIKRYPKLTEIGAWRKETVRGDHRVENVQFDKKRHGGYYTQEELKELVLYAAERCVEIIPEIEMPGHAQAALAAYPYLGCEENHYEVSTTWGVHQNVFCTNDSVFYFIKNVIDEVIDIFPSKYIHIGGDECPKDKWQMCSTCQANIRNNNLQHESHLQSFFISRISNYIKSKGKNMIGWDEILEGGIAEDAIVMSWRGESGGIKAAEMGHSVIMSPTTHCYLDYYQNENIADEPLAMGGMLLLEKVYSYNPTANISSSASKFIMGVQGNLWTEYISDVQYADYMAFPRIIALSEVAWTQQEKKDYISFLKRLNVNSEHLDFLRVNYASHFKRIIK